MGALVQEIDVKDSSLSLPKSIDLAYNMIHGTFGEDGQIQQILERQGIPYTGEGIAGSQLAFDKILSKRAFDEHGVPTGRWHVIAAGQTPRLEVPFVVKSPRQGSSVGVHIIKDFADLDAALARVGELGGRVVSDVMEREGFGRFAYAADPTEAGFGLVQSERANDA